jgi:hypothetical protein
MRIYLDYCCFNRPFDDQSQARIGLVVVKKMQGFARIAVMNPTRFIVEVE